MLRGILYNWNLGIGLSFALYLSTKGFSEIGVP
jgi:hypothetical protein